MRRRVVHAMAAAVCLLAVQPARAQSGAGAQPDAVTAQALFDDAKALMKQGRYAEACAKFESSHRIDPKAGTVLNLAHCYEQTGQTASAWARYVEAAELAMRAQQRERQDYARERAHVLSQQLARLTIKAETLPPGAIIHRDGLTVDRMVLGAAVPIDPGEHALEVVLGDKPLWSTHVTVAPRASIEVVIPASALQRAVAGDTPVEQPPIVKPVPAKPEPVQPSESAPASTWSGRKTLAVVVAGVGVVGLGVGTAFGLKASSKWSDAKDKCTPEGCPDDAIELGREVKTDGAISTVAFIAGGAALVGAGILWFTAPRTPTPSHARWQLVPSADPRSGSAWLTAKGTF
ncbi:tetratricopeptide repeat protein [Pendulispora brunnea]|uniref:Tetratricopeptide repeat protein n=1 Tax=Pendulispora brunnea TaxID=2905690 RepID=A0ABZ2KCD7_9BACT